ncbi:MAG: GGDEF domain-containing protein [Methylocystaceae bacterium]|nr:GGDEF domain-containing protein [Methylocystaceae bacterium]
MEKEKQPEIIGSFLIGVAKTFYSINALTAHKLDSLLQNLKADQWYPLAHLHLLFDALKQSPYYSELLLYQAGANFIQNWYDTEGKALNLGSIGHMRLQDNSAGVKLVCRNYDPDFFFTEINCLDLEKGYLELNTSSPMPIAFLKGLFYNGLWMWGDLLWLDMEVIECGAHNPYHHIIMKYSFRTQTIDRLDDIIDDISNNKCKIDNFPELTKELAWKVKGLRQVVEMEKKINTESASILGKALKRQVEINNQLEEATETIKEQAIKDHLTEIYNKRFFDISYEKMWFQCMRQKKNISIFMIDVDHFKLYNDRYGHLNGDTALKTIAKLISNLFHRAGDIVARFGGEEFIVAISDTPQDVVTQLAQKINTVIEDAKLVHEHSPVSNFITVSIGSASTVPKESICSPEKLIAQADVSLYKAKKAGRNCHAHKNF